MEGVMFSDTNDVSGYRPSGRPVSAEEQVWEFHAARLNDVVNRAYQEWPLHSHFRRVMIGKAMDRAEAALKVFIPITDHDKGQLLRNYAGLMSADAEGRQETVADFMGAWMHVFSVAFERTQAGAA
jgi:hypothetical protein